ncbi:MAG: hypothetical protein ACE5J5_05150 [Candidatus Hydrothermarchaeales archaeon]
MDKKNVLLLFFALVIASLPTAHAQAGLYVSQHNVTYRLFENRYQVEEKIIFENTGKYVFTVQKWVNLERGNATDVEVEGIDKKNIKVYDEEYPTIIRWYLEVNKGPAKEVTIRYSRNDQLSELDNIKTYKGDALGRYSWETSKVNIKFIPPEGYQFGNVTPYVPKKIVDNREEISYNLVYPEDRIFLTYGLPVEINYAKFKELAFAKMDVARGKIADAKNNIERTNITIENSRGYEANLTESLILYNHSILILNISEEELSLAEEAYDSPSNAFYEAYMRAINTESLAEEVSEKATKAEQKANFEVQKALNEKINALTSIMTQVPTETPLPETTVPPTTQGPTTSPPTTPMTTTPLPLVMTKAPQAKPLIKSRDTLILLLILIVAAVGLGSVIIKKEKPSGRRGEVGDFRVIGDLKRKKFKGFEEKVDRVKKEVEIASEIRKLRKDRNELESQLNEIEKERIEGKMNEDAFVAKKGEIEESMHKVDSKLKPLEEDLDKIKRVTG